MTARILPFALILSTLFACQPDAEEPGPPPPQDSIALRADTPVSQTFDAGGGRTTIAFVSSGP